MRHNILFADENITDEKLDETFGMMYLVSTMPEGADTMIDEQYNLSTAAAHHNSQSDAKRFADSDS